jgi:dolichol kinase
LRLKKAELKRKVLHIAAFLIPIICLKLERNAAILFWLLLLSVAVIVEVLRRTSRGFSKIFNRIFGPLLRSGEESRKLTGATYLFLGGFLSFLIFPKGVAILSTSYLAVGDGFATIVGLRWGRHPILRKTLEGTLAFIVLSTIASLIVHWMPFWIRIVGVLVAATVELVSIPISDNLNIPLISGLVMWCLLKIL